MPVDITQLNLLDLGVKLLFRRYPGALLRLARVVVVSGSVVSVETDVIIKELSADDVFVYLAPAGKEAIHAEYQAVSDRREVLRWLQKVLALEEAMGIPVVLLVIYLRRGDRATFPDDYTVGSGSLTNYHRFAVVRLWEEAERIRNGELPELTPLLPLIEDRPPEQAVQESRDLIQQMEIDPEARGELLSVCHLVGLKYLLRGALDAIFREDLPMLKEAGIIGEWIEESLKRGREEGREEGRDSQARRFALGFIERRFGSVPDDLRRRIEVESVEWCEALCYSAAEVESLTELRLP